jgi:hypothetical protein
MNQPPTPNSPLDGLLNVLRSAATPDELSGEATAVQAMASAIADPPRGTFVMKSTARARRVVGLTTIGVLGFAGVAAAGRGVFVPDYRPTIETPGSKPKDDDETTLVATTLVGTTLVGTTLVGTTLVETTLVETTLAVEVECAEGNHGKTVSSVAKETEPGPGHGEAVSAAAQSDCGKTEGTTVATSVPSETTVAEDHGGKPDDPGSQGRAHKPLDPGSQGHG